MRPHRTPLSVFAALAFTLLVPAVGYVYLGALVASIFLIGYGSGFLLWWFRPTDAPFASIRAPYWLTLAAFALHKVEENRAEFFEILSREITGIPVPETTPLLFFLLLVIPAGAWLLVPWLMNRRNPLGAYLACTFFASMAVSELAHFVFPLLTRHAYGYFPGMATVFVLTPLGAWGLYRLWSSVPHRATR